ncbi:MAG: TetR/AcrR family transcriptional regulator [Oscillospiraceae bacterium]
MSGKVNQRVMLTKRLIKESLVHMLAVKSIYKISVRELCEDAGINRTTFYKYFGSQYDVLSEFEDEFLSHVQDALADISDDPARQLDTICTYFDKNAELARLLMNNNVDPDFPGKLFNLPPIRKMLLEKLSGRYDQQEIEFVCTFVVNGGYRMIQEWISDEERKSPSMIAALILELAEKVCKR